MKMTPTGITWTSGEGGRSLAKLFQSAAASPNDAESGVPGDCDTLGNSLYKSRRSRE